MNKPHDALMCGFKPIPKGAKLLNEFGNPFRQAENPPAEIGEIIFRYCPPGGIIIDPFCGTAPVAEQAMRQGKRVILLDRDPLVLAAARTRHLQRYEYLKKNNLLPEYYTVADTVNGNQSDREIEATENELKQVHWVQEVKLQGLDDRSIPKSNLPSERCEHPISIKKSLLVDDEAMAFASVSSSKWSLSQSLLAYLIIRVHRHTHAHAHIQGWEDGAFWEGGDVAIGDELAWLSYLQNFKEKALAAV